jgi:hypothetical protein
VPPIIDAGADSGASALTLAVSWPKTWVIAIEPDAVALELLRSTTGGLPK